jgi:hypothetical protein
VNEQQAGLYDYDFVHLIACCIRDSTVLANVMPLSRIIIHNLFTIGRTLEKLEDSS